MNIPWEDLELLFAISTERSFSAAARRIGLTQPTVSRRIQALEERLGVELFVRDAEGARLSDAGLRLVPAIDQMARLAEEAKQALEDGERPRGEVQVGAQGGSPSEILFFLARDLRKSLPLVSIRARFGDSETAFERGVLDMWITCAPLPKRARPLFHATLDCGVFVSKGYARRLERKPGRGRYVARDLEWVGSAPVSGARTRGAESREVSGRPGDGRRKARKSCDSGFTTDSYEHQLRATEMGLGAMILPRLTATSTPQGALVEIDVEIEILPIEVNVALQPGAEMVREVRALSERFTEALRDEPSVTLHAD